MRVSRHPPLHLTYCLNIHPGESFRDQWDAVKTFSTAVRHQLETGEGRVPRPAEPPFGLGLRLSRRASDEAHGQSVARDFAAWCRDQGFYVFTINGFPYGAFHRSPVKASVYRPDWTCPERCDYTKALADLLAQWLPPSSSGSISTVPCWYAPDYAGESSRQTARTKTIHHLIEVARHLERIALETGRDLCLGLEPEPWCFLETSHDVVTFFRDHLFASPDPNEEAIIRRRIGVCVDTCHCALAYEQPASVIQTLHAEGIRIAKIQLSAALSIRRNSGWPVALQPFAEPVYFHQTAARCGKTMRRWPDLPEALPALAAADDWDEARVHFHVPLHWAGSGTHHSTRDQMDEAFWRLISSGICPHLEIETYTYDILPEELTSGGLIESIAQEYRWVMEKSKTFNSQEGT